MGEKRKRVLIVEDEPSIAEALRFLMTRAGLEAHVAQDGKLALKATQTARLDLLIVDLNLPKLSGAELIRLVRGQELNRETPILVLTARGQHQDRERVREIGANAFMGKPFDNGELVAQVLSLVERGHQKAA